MNLFHPKLSDFIKHPKVLTWIHSPMPGSIQVSVLDFKELSSTSNSVKVSLGKVEHEAREKGAFSFPLTNLRDNLIITIRDSDGNQVSQSGVRTVSIIEKGTWDYVFPIEGGGLIHLKLQFLLSDEERNRIRSMRELAIKKKQDEILGSRHDVSDVLRASSSQVFQNTGFSNDISFKASESRDELQEESLQRQSITNVPDKREGTSLAHMPEQKSNSLNDLVEKFYDKSLKEKIQNDVKESNEEDASNKNNAVLLQQGEAPEKLLEETKARDFLKSNNAFKSEPLFNPVEKLDKQIPEDKNLSFVKKTSKESKFRPSSKETEVNTSKNNEIQLQETNLPKRLQDPSSNDAGLSRLTVSEKIKSFSTKLAGEMDKKGSVEKTPQNIKKMISVFESTISQDRVLLKPASTKSYRFGTSRLVKDSTVKDDYETSEKLGSTRLRNSFSTGDLRKNLSHIVTKGDEVDLDNNFVEPSENTQSKENDLNSNDKIANEDLYNDKESTEGGTTSKDNLDYFDQDGSGQHTFLDERRQLCMTAEVDQEQIVVKDEEIESPRRADIEASNGSFGQVLKIAFVVGFGVLVLIFRQRESGKEKKKERTRNQVFMNKRRSVEEAGWTIGVSRLS